MVMSGATARRRVCRLALLGGGPAAYAVLDLVERLTAAGERYEVVAVLDDVDPADASDRAPRPGPPVDGPLAALADLGADAFAVASDEPAARRAATASVPTGMPAATLVHPDALLRAPFRLGEGCIVHARATVNAHLGRSVWIGAGAGVSHHSRIGEFSVVHAGALLLGDIEVGSDVTIGRRATVTERRRVGSGAIVAVRSVVIADAAARSTVAGVPARPVTPW